MKHVTASKFQSEEIPISVDMRGRCDIALGEYITLANVNCTVLSGEDPSPESMISGSATIINNSIVQQLVIGGLSGVIYELWIAVRTNLGNVYIDTVPLAVIFDASEPPAIP